MNNRIDSINDIVFLENWFHQYACGYQNARKKKDILPFINFDERYFRNLVSASNIIFSSSDRGYWILPEKVGEQEKKIALDSLREERSRTISLYLKIKNKKKHLIIIIINILKRSCFETNIDHLSNKRTQSKVSQDG